MSEPLRIGVLGAARIIDASDLTVLEGFHYRYHPQFARLAELASGDVIGELQRLDVTMRMSAPGDDDLRWSWPLAGGGFDGSRLLLRSSVGCPSRRCSSEHAMPSFCLLCGGQPPNIVGPGLTVSNRPLIGSDTLPRHLLTLLDDGSRPGTAPGRVGPCL